MGAKEELGRFTEDGIDDVVCDFEGRFEIFCEGNVEVFELLGKALIHFELVIERVI